MASFGDPLVELASPIILNLALTCSKRATGVAFSHAALPGTDETGTHP